MVFQHQPWTAPIRARADWGLCRPRHEKDSCGFGLIASLDDRASHWVLQTAISSLNRLTHRGAIATDGKTGDGCGLLIKQPTAFLRAVAQEAGLTLAPSVCRRPRVPEPRCRTGRRGARRVLSEQLQLETARASPAFARLPTDPDGLRFGSAQDPAGHRADVRQRAGATSTKPPFNRKLFLARRAARKNWRRRIRSSISRRCRPAPSSTRAW